MFKKTSMFSFTRRDFMIFLLILSAATAISFLLRPLDGGGRCALMLFQLAVFLISRYTSGYLFGLLTSVVGVVLVNYIFTYPYFAVNFTIPGYPVTFLSMLIVSLMTSTMTTQIKQQEKLRAETEKEKMRGNLLRAVSHDLRTPLTSIVGVTSTLLESGEAISAEQRNALLTEAHDDADWLIRMVENLLSVTRINGETAAINKTSEIAEEIMSYAVQKFQKRFPDAVVSVTVPEDILFVPVDPILIGQVICNLLENAVLHGKRRDGIEFTVEQNGSSAIFSVRDHGVGLTEADIPHLFDGYLVSRDPSDFDSTRNMGIGLSVCRSIIHAHGGKLTAENCPDGGALFRFILPLEESTHVV